MLLIGCPWCGDRAEAEFACTGEHRGRRPPDAGLSNQAWTDWLFGRDNPRGTTQERWVHLHGCGQWLIVERSTVTHRIFAVCPAGER